ncbi:ABC transporter permease [Anaerobium acetethylicum]|uniref:Simple sugar transport system permease protein n=1 Tax=Anaerobium acetethylicum TaxID=1619234 RepID=A0A1D3TNN6_9FIRM|nr:ABC transporter permease [Anaerobium acetethylicum]SCP94924.1 simple sugar transport system permease protein [Anaerobium acetethylicum]
MIINFLFAAIKAGTPLLFGTTGEIMTQKTGNLNLGVEGMMFMGAFVGFFTGYKTGSITLALLAAFAVGVFAALIYAFLTVSLRANQNVTGLTLTIFGTGFAQFFGERMIAAAPDKSPKLPAELVAALSEKAIPLLGDIPYIGKLLFSHNIIVYLGVCIAFICGIYINRTKAGLNMRAVGENPAAADAAGINVTAVKYIHILAGGGICGIGGAYLSLINGGGVWNNSCVNGQGWIAVALVIFASWSPVKAILGSLIFGAFSVLQFYVPKDIIELPNAFYIALPFLITIIVLVFTSMKKSKEGAQPAGCGINYFREDR